jgi:hypothetical protein
METLLAEAGPVSLPEAAKATIELLNSKPQTPERAKHKFKMIRIAEICADAYRRTGVYDDERLDTAQAWVDVQEAAEFCD